MPESDALSFKTLRPWNGERSRAFEELSFQLLKDQVPKGARAIRTGNPDGGVEWYAILPDGAEWGWQAKDVDGIDNLLTAMRGSVERVAKERPTLKKLTFVISWNLATGKTGKDGRLRKSQRERYEDRVASWKASIPGADKIEFELVQESDLLDLLAKPEHRGRRWFWWNRTVFGQEWLTRQYKQQADAAGEKYSPALQVDVPIQEDLLALGFDQSILAAFEKHRRALVSAAVDLHGFPKDAGEAAALLYTAIRDNAASLKSAAETIILEAADPARFLKPLQRRLEACIQAIDAARTYEHQLAAEIRELPKDDPRRESKPPTFANEYSVRALYTAVNVLSSWLDGPVGAALQGRTYFLTGQAGSGKTHLFLDATMRALSADRPAVFLAGARFGKSDLWASVADQLGLGAVGSDELLGAMDAAGEAAAVSGRRFVMFVDALNDTVPADFWRTHLPSLRAAIAAYPHVALAVSCRDTYRDLVLEGSEEKRYIHRTHPGFAEREVEAAHTYFRHFGIEEPKFPLLTPEFTLPLFLRLYCESLSDVAAGEIPQGHQGRITIFERYLEVKIKRVARRLRPDASSSYELRDAKARVTQALNALLDVLSERGHEGMGFEDADALTKTALTGSGLDAARLLGLLQDEGILTRERLYLDSGKFEEGVRLVFQAFSDFLLLKRRLASSADPMSDASLKKWLGEECSWGIQEAASILFPEVYSVELLDFLKIVPVAEPNWNVSEAAWNRYHRARQLYRSWVETLPYRDSTAISQRTIDHLNGAQRYLSRDEFYRPLFIMAPQPNNRLNGEGLHRYLLQAKMPRRDRDFGFATYHELNDPSTPVSRLARWAASGPYPTYDPHVIELASIPLCWLLSSPNRYMRDWVTKALVQLLRGHLDVMCTLVDRFWAVDDPYVVQRVLAIAYGAVLRSEPEQAGQAAALAQLVLERVFTRPIRPDELMLDVARGIIRWAVDHEFLPESTLASSRRPYGLKPPSSPPTKASIDKKYGWQKDQDDDLSYSSILFSLFDLGDFARYVVEPGVHHFSRYRLGDVYPERQQGKPRINITKWKKFLASLDEGQRESLDAWLRNPDESSMSPLSFLVGREKDPLNETQRELLDLVFVRPRPVTHTYPEDLACRWIFRRTLSLGWTPKFFGQRDRFIGHGRGGESHKAERWGKKYQWIAYHELLARVADNFQTIRDYDGQLPYEGLHQIIADREIDPSLPPVDYRVINDEDSGGAPTWKPSAVQLVNWPRPIRFSAYQEEMRLFLADSNSEPTISSSIFAQDVNGDKWLVLDSYVKKVDPTADKGWRGLQERSAVETYFVPAGTARALLPRLSGDGRDDLLGVLGSEGHVDCCYVGEIGRTGPTCPHRVAALHRHKVSGKAFNLSATVEKYMWEGSLLDCSINESVKLILPSTFTQNAARLSFDEHGPSWTDAHGVVFFYQEATAHQALLVRSEFLQSFLAEHELELVILHWFERMDLRGNHSDQRPYVESHDEAWLGSDLDIHAGSPRRRTR